MSKQPKTLKKEDGEKTRKLIMETARSLFMEYGYRAVSTRKIAEVCKITQPALYHHFSNKQAIYLEMLRINLEQMKQSLLSIINSKRDLQECLEHIIYYLLKTYPYNLNQLFHDIKHEIADENQKVLRQWWEEACLAPISALLQTASDEGSVHVPANTSVKQYAYLLMSLVSQSEMEKLGSEAEVKEKAQFLSEFIMFGISTTFRDNKKA